MVRTALITGITGQDGSYLAEFLLKKGYEVTGLVRRSSSHNISRIEHICDSLNLIEGDMHDASSLDVAIQQTKPDEVYNLAAQSFVATSWTQPLLTMDVNGLGFIRLMEAIRRHKPDAKLYQASSSEMYGLVNESPQNENTKFYPRSPYACSKVLAYHQGVNYKESYGLFICNGILFNHESPRRGIEFVTRKITDGVAKIHHGLAKSLSLGNLQAQRDWGFAGDYVKAMWLMLQQDEPRDFVIATGESHSVEEFAKIAFGKVGLDWREYVDFDPKLLRPAETHALCGDASKGKKDLGWFPETDLDALITMMVEADVSRYQTT